MTLFFKRKELSGRADAALELTRQARAILEVDDEVAVSVSEHDCGEAGCCGLQTVVLVLRPGHSTKAIKIGKPIESVTRDDLSEALAPSAANARPARTHSPTT